MLTSAAVAQRHDATPTAFDRRHFEIECQDAAATCQTHGRPSRGALLALHVSLITLPPFAVVMIELGL